MNLTKLAFELILSICILVAGVSAQETKSLPATQALNRENKQQTSQGTVVTENIRSAKLQNTRTGLNPNRTIKVYLPPGYSGSSKSYPVIYYFHSLNWSATQCLRMVIW